MRFKTVFEKKIEDEQLVEKKTVQTYFEFVNIGEIDTMKEAFQAELIIESKWKTSESIDKYDPKVHWNPELYIENALNVNQSCTYVVTNEDDLLCVTEIRKAKGTFWQRLDLRLVNWLYFS